MSHMQRVRMSRTVHEVPRHFTAGHHPGGKAGNTGLDNGQQLHAPLKHRPFREYPDTGVPKAAEEDGRPFGAVRAAHPKGHEKGR